MKKILLLLALLSSSAFAGERQVINPDLNGNLFLRVYNGAVLDALRVDGATGALTLGASGFTGTHTMNGAALIDGAVAGNIPLTIQGAAGQSANLFVVENSAGSDLTTVDSAGNLTAASLATTGTVFANNGMVGWNNTAVLKMFQVTADPSDCTSSCAAQGNCGCVATVRVGFDVQDTCSTSNNSDKVCLCVCDDF